eukprot:m.166224 g.166224  ORF g.166224 m.166224 type:complete len:66 (-) comp21099_c3_seq1:1647-1844(-)
MRRRDENDDVEKERKGDVRGHSCAFPFASASTNTGHSCTLDGATGQSSLPTYWPSTFTPKEPSTP